MISSKNPRIFNIPTNVPFLDTLAEFILDGHIITGWPNHSDPLSLSQATIFLPTSRSANEFEEKLLMRASSRKILLPKILPLGEVDEIENRNFLQSGIEHILNSSRLLPEIDPLRRRLILTKYILSWSKQIELTLNDDEKSHRLKFPLDKREEIQTEGFAVARSIGDGLELADALGTLIDTLSIYGKNWEDVHNLLPQDLADDYWRISKDFLQIAADVWPNHCQMEGVMDAAERRHLIITKESERLLLERPQAPFIVAGSTGSMLATAKLISAIAQLPKSAIVLQGLDQHLDSDTWAQLTGSENRIKSPTHPQAQLSRLLREVGVIRSDVINIGMPSRELEDRGIFLSEAMRPHEMTDLWLSTFDRISHSEIAVALSEVTIIEADNEHEEAVAIAVAIRQGLTRSDKKIALITPDRSLAERVRCELLRWKIVVQDSAGTPLRRTNIGTLAMLLSDAIVDTFSPVSLLALLNHPDAKFGITDEEKRKGVDAFDIGLLRYPLESQSLSSIRKLLDSMLTGNQANRLPLPVRRLTSLDWAAANSILMQLESISAQFKLNNKLDFVSYLMFHQEAIRKITASSSNQDLIHEIEGAAELGQIYESAKLCSDLDIRGPEVSYPSTFKQLMSGINLTENFDYHPRIQFLGLLEARLMSSDLVILGGLDESIWPPETHSDPFLNRPWREELGLPTPERRIGQTAHDLIGLMGNKEIIITRANKRGGAPTIASRFLQRMRAVAGSAIFDSLLVRGAKFLALSRKIDENILALPLQRPSPIPESSLLPVKLSVTEIEILRRDPYSIYAKHVLKLDQLNPIGYEIGASERGNIFHIAVARFSQNWPTQQPPDALEKLLSIGRDVFLEMGVKIEQDAFWWPRFRNAADWYINWDEIRRADIITPLSVERHGAFTLPLPRGGSFTLSGQADRIEIHAKGRFSIIDFKTGKIPSDLQVNTGFSPQLTLEAAMVKRGAFLGVSGTEVEALIYVKLGGKEGGYEKFIRDSERSLDCDGLSEIHFSELISLIDNHWNGKRPFFSRPHPQFTTDYGKYDHLARVREWSLSGGDPTGGEDE